MDIQVHFETTHIKRVTHNGVELVDGRHHKLDVLVCATGFDTSYRMPFDVIGREGRDLRVQWEPHASAYLAVAVDGFPNMFMSLGPNSFVNAGSLLGLMERQVDYAVAATLKLQRERLKSMEVKAEAVADYNEYLKVSVNYELHRKQIICLPFCTVGLFSKGCTLFAYCDIPLTAIL